MYKSDEIIYETKHFFILKYGYGKGLGIYHKGVTYSTLERIVDRGEQTYECAVRWCERMEAKL